MSDLREQIVAAIQDGFRFKHPNQPMNRHRVDDAADRILALPNYQPTSSSSKTGSSTPAPRAVESERYVIINGWLCEDANGCTCAAPPGYGHEIGCGTEPIAKVEDLLTPLPAETPRVVTTVAELEALPVDTVVRDGDLYLWSVAPNKWFLDGGDRNTKVNAECVTLPATVLTPAAEQVNVTAERVEAAARAAFEVGNPTKKDGMWSWEWMEEHYPDDLKVWRDIARAALRAANVTEEEK